MTLYSRESSAKRRQVEDTHSGRSLIKIRNKSGPRTMPWETPDVTGAAVSRGNSYENDLLCAATEEVLDPCQCVAAHHVVMEFQEYTSVRYFVERFREVK